MRFAPSHELAPNNPKTSQFLKYNDEQGANGTAAPASTCSRRSTE